METRDPSLSEHSPVDRKLIPIELGSYPDQLETLEHAAIAKRRKEAGETTTHSPVGLALSGGGVRSATFSLGFLQALARKSLLRKIDFLSTVSGGGYIGSFLGLLFTRPWVNPNKKIDSSSSSDPCRRIDVDPGEKPAGKNAAECVENILHPNNLRSKPVAWLRENGRYLSPNGSGDTLLALGIYLRNWASVQIVIGIFVLTLFLLTNCVRVNALKAAVAFLNVDALQSLLQLSPGLPQGFVWWSPYVLFPLMSALFLVVPFGWAYWLVTAEKAESAGWFTPWAWVPVLGISTGSLWLRSFDKVSSGLSRFLFILAICSSLTLFIYGFLRLRHAGRILEIFHEPKLNPSARTLLLRNRLSSWFSTCLWITIGLLIFAIIDSLGQTLYAYLRYTGFLCGLVSFKTLAAATGITSLIAFAQRIAVSLSGLASRDGRGRLKLPLNILAWAAALILLLAVLASVASIAHGIAWGWKVPKGNPGRLIAERYALKDKVKLSSEQYIMVDKSVSDETTDCERKRDRSAGVDMMNSSWLFSALIVSILLSLAFGFTFQFLNQSTYAPLYSARLTRAYLGASNPLRWKDKGRGVTEVINCDEVKMDEYTPHVEGGPLHLINVTLNETVSGRSQIEQRDRKGLGMAVGPFAISVGVKHHALWQETKAQTLWQRFGNISKGLWFLKPDHGFADKKLGQKQSHFQIFQERPFQSGIEAETLSLGQWTGISGAAFSTGLGSRTSLGLSLLSGMANVRLGYWWNSGVDPNTRVADAGKSKLAKTVGKLMAKIFPVQMYLLDEFTARFHGPARRYWYLTDGGHFENMACYELIRRRVPFIIACDNGCDPTYEFSDLANLVRKARTDFNAEIVFLEDDELKELLDDPVSPFIGPLEQLRRGKWSEEPVLSLPPKNEKRKTIFPETVDFSFVHASLAKICYDGSPKAGSILLLIKPTLIGEEPVDLIEYHASHNDFPQETTLDQYFDEAQWESYRKLGEWIGVRLFNESPNAVSTGKWSPKMMDARKLLERINRDTPSIYG